MSFGFSIGDFIAIGQLAYDLFSACKNASEDYSDLGKLCRTISIAIEGCRPNDPNTVLRRQNVETIKILTADCEATLERLKDILGRYQSTSGIRNIGKKVGFINTKQERIDIRARLQEHLSAISAFSNGVQIETLGLTVRLVWRLLQSQGEGLNAADLQTIVDDPDQLSAVLKDFTSANKGTQEELLKNQDAVKKGLQDTIAQGLSSGSSNLTDQSSQSKKPDQASSERFSWFAPATTAVYGPSELEWMSSKYPALIGIVAVSSSPLITYKPFNVQISYSPEDAYLCELPEGWSITPTLVERDSKTEDAYYYSFNNLSCATGNSPRVSRAYCVNNPFLSDAEKDSWGLYTSPLPAMRFYFDASKIYSANKAPAMTSHPGTGILHHGLLIDLKDDVSRQLIQIETGNNGQRQLYSDNSIDASLPESWTWDPDDSGKGRHIYIDTETGEESTVHPARFYDPTSDASTSLPPGWVRRLDAWGNLFFVDHNTKSAAREDPRFNSNIDVATGLPKGWEKILDHEGNPFFFRVHGKMILGTWNAKFMNDGSVKGKKILKAVPKEGEDPHLLDLKSRPRDRQRAQERDKVGQTLKTEVRDMTPEEKQNYYKLFTTVSRQNPLFLSLGEAKAHCYFLRIPPSTVEAAFWNIELNRNLQLNCDQYANLLHRIRMSLENDIHTKTIPPPTAAESQLYDQMFFKKAAGKPVLSLEEVMELCRGFNLPSDLIDRIWLQADANHDRLFNPTEFENGMHQILKEHERRQVMQMNMTMPIPQTNVAAPSTPSVGNVQAGVGALTVSDAPAPS